MALKVGDRVKQTSTTTGTGTITLNGAAPTGFSSFRDYLSDGDTTYYVIEDGTNYEIGLGTFNTGGSATADTIARASDANVYRSTNSNNRVNWSSGTRSVFISEPSDKAVFLDGSGDLNLTGALSLIDSGSGGILNIGNSSDLQIYHNGSNTIFNNQTGNFFLIQGSDDADLYLSCDDQQGGTTSYIWLDGSEGEVKLRHAASGSASTKLTTKSTGVDVNGTVTATTFSGGLASDNLTVGDSAVTLSTTSGNITIDADGNDTDIIFKGTDGGLGRTYLTIDGSDAGTAQFSHDIKLYDDGLLRLGHNSDLEIGHIITESIISNYTVDLNITNYANDKDISILTDDGSGGTALYFKADGSTGETLLYHYGSEKLATKSTGVDVTGTITADVLTVAADTDATTTLGRALIHSPASDGAAFSHVDKTALTDYALFQSANGTTYINASSGTNINFNNNNSNIAYISSTGLRLGAGKDLMFEGATGDNFETFVTVTDPTADRTITLPDATGTVLINASNQSITGDLTLISTASGNGDGPALTLKRDNTPTGNFFNQGHIEFLGENQSGTEIKYGEIKVQASTTSAGNEESRMVFKVMNDGADKEMMYLDAHQQGGVLYLTGGIDILFEGTDTNNDTNETRLTYVNPTADRTITLPDASGTVALTSQIGSTAADDITTGDAAVTIATTSGNITIDAQEGNADIIFKGTDNTTDITMLTLDASLEGRATFNKDVVADQFSGNIYIGYNKEIRFEGSSLNSFDTILTVIDPTNTTKTISLPDATGTVITTGNSDTPTTTTSSGDADFVLVDDGGTMKKITPANLGIGSGGGSSVAADNITTGDSAVTIKTTSGNINITNQADDSDIILSSDDGSGGTTPYITLDGSEGGVTLFHNSDNFYLGMTRLQTTSGGVTVTGDLAIESPTNLLPVLTFKNTSTSISNDDILGIVSFQAPNESSGGVADNPSAKIQARAASSFTDVKNKSELEFFVHQYDANGTYNNLTKVATLGEYGIFTLNNNYATSASGGTTLDSRFRFERDGSTNGSEIGTMQWLADISSGAQIAYAEIQAKIVDSSSTAKDGKLHFKVSGNNSTVSDIMTIDADGVDITGALTASGNITAYSDERLKSDIKTIDNALDKVMNIRGVSYNKEKEKGIGVIAQEIEKVIPEVVTDGEYKSVAYGNMVGVLIEAIKEQQKQIDEQQKQIFMLQMLMKDKQGT